MSTGRGAFPAYDGKADTKGTAEFSAGLSLPLLRGRAIDERRAARETTALGVERAEGSLDQARLAAFRAALGHYWDWVAAARQQRVARALLDSADARDVQLADAVALGQIAPIERLDNRRAILQRRSALVAAERLLEQRAIDLSLYLRDAQGQPQRPAVARARLATRSTWRPRCPTKPRRCASPSHAVPICGPPHAARRTRGGAAPGRERAPALARPVDRDDARHRRRHP